MFCVFADQTVETKYLLSYPSLSEFIPSCCTLSYSSKTESCTLKDPSQKVKSITSISLITLDIFVIEYNINTWNIWYPFQKSMNIIFCSMKKKVSFQRKL